MAPEKDWKMKARTRCPLCKGDGSLCNYCSGGKITIEVSPSEIKDFLARPEKAEFECVGCTKKETILRPLPSQIPSGWINWNSEVLCQDCKAKVILSAIVAIEGKITRLKESKR
jgi:hypothetical protein